MKGISEALVATAMGLGVAIPCVMLFNYFSSAIKRKMSNSEEVTNIIVALRRATRSGNKVV
jgi:biopolymer transport protein ExbB